jgi:hypothetical protein
MRRIGDEDDEIYRSFFGTERQTSNSSKSLYERGSFFQLLTAPHQGSVTQLPILSSPELIFATCTL